MSGGKHRGKYRKPGRPEHMLPRRERDERLIAAEREVMRLRKLAATNPHGEGRLYNLAADRVLRDEVEPLKRLIEAEKLRRSG